MSTRPIRKFSEDLAVNETYFFLKGSVFIVQCSVLSSAGPTEVKRSSAVDVAKGSMGLKSDFSVGKALSQP
jgi:hypothetical protein